MEADVADEEDDHGDTRYSLCRGAVAAEVYDSLSQSVLKLWVQNIELHCQL